MSLSIVNALGPMQWLAFCTNNCSMGTCMRCAARVLCALHVLLQEVSSWGCSLLGHTLGALAAGLAVLQV